MMIPIGRRVTLIVIPAWSETYLSGEIGRVAAEESCPEPVTPPVIEVGATPARRQICNARRLPCAEEVYCGT